MLQSCGEEKERIHYWYSRGCNGAERLCKSQKNAVQFKHRQRNWVGDKLGSRLWGEGHVWEYITPSGDRGCCTEQREGMKKQWKKKKRNKRQGSNWSLMLL